jgi:hypothetical protein
MKEELTSMRQDVAIDMKLTHDATQHELQVVREMISAVLERLPQAPDGRPAVAGEGIGGFTS